MAKEQVYFFLDDAKDLLDDITNSYGSLNDIIEIPISLKHKIKRFLDNINSSLDYTIVELYQDFLDDKKTVSNNDMNKIKRLQFPNKKDKNQFDAFFVKHFSTDIEKNLSIKAILEDTQQFNGVTWLDDLKQLSNGNKHRTLSPQSFDGSFHIKYLKYGGLVMTNCYSNSLAAFGFGDESLLDLALKKKIDADFNIEATIYFYFEEINKEVNSCLNNILFNTREVVDKLYEL